MTLPHLTVAYITGRPEPMFRWFHDSLRRECGGDYTGITTVCVDRFKDDRSNTLPFDKHVAPMPGVWQGKYRLTKRDYFAASNARNTALCLAPHCLQRVFSYGQRNEIVYPSNEKHYGEAGWIAYVDDLSVLMPGWLACVREAMAKDYIVLGAYKKVLNLQVDDNGNATYQEFAPGVDSRWGKGKSDAPVIAAGSWLFGCSLAAPVEAFMRINGWDSDADSLGSEDYLAGIMLEKAGYRFMYDRRMLTLESEERHHDGSALPRFDKGKSPNDKSHKILDMVVNGGRHIAPNYFGEGGIRAVRERVLRGEPFPIIQSPQHDWYDGQPLSEL